MELTFFSNTFQGSIEDDKVNLGEDFKQWTEFNEEQTPWFEFIEGNKKIPLLNNIFEI